MCICYMDVFLPWMCWLHMSMTDICRDVRRVGHVDLRSARRCRAAACVRSRAIVSWAKSLRIWLRNAKMHRPFRKSDEKHRNRPKLFLKQMFRRNLMIPYDYDLSVMIIVILWLLKHFDITAQWHSGSSTIQESNEVRLQLVLIALTLSHVSFLNLIDITEPSCCKTYTISPSGCLCELGWTGGLPIAELILVRSLRL